MYKNAEEGTITGAGVPDTDRKKLRVVKRLDG